MDGTTLRIAGSQAQAFWCTGALIAYNLIGRKIADAAFEAKRAPTDISFVHAVHTIRHEMMGSLSTCLCKRACMPSAAARTVEGVAK
nr:hypothetical protein [Caballeronia catudaia]